MSAVTLEADCEAIPIPESAIGTASRFLLVMTLIAVPLSGCSSVGNTLGGLFGGDTVSADEPAETAESADASSSDASSTQAAPPASGLVFGGDAESRSRFSAPSSGDQGAPDLNSVPTSVPTPSPQAERDQALEGLIADRANARHSNQRARSIPVAVRPLEPASNEPTANAPPPVPQAAAVDPVTRLADIPPPRPAEAGGEDTTAADTSDVLVTPPTPARPAAGPRSSTPNLPRNSIASDENGVVQAAAFAQFLPLSSFNASEFSISSNVASLPSVARGITPEDRRVLLDAANLRRDARGVLRVVGHGGSEPSAAVLAVRVAEVLASMGVPADRLYVGADGGTGPVEVLLDH